MLTPEIQTIVDRMAPAPDAPDDLVPIAEARATHDDETAELSGPGDAVAEVRELELPGPGGPLRVRLYRPLEKAVAGGRGLAGQGGAPGDDPLPLVAYLHGGGWAVGSLDGFDPLCRALANASGALIAAIDYRLAPEHPFPAAPDDVCAAVRWLAAHAADLGGDPARLGIAGDSAGGNLAAVTARRLRDAGDSPLRFQALIYPVCDSALDTASYRENGSGFGLTQAGMRRYWELYLGGADGSDPGAAPLRAGDLAGLPPAFVLSVHHDVLRDEGEEYARALRAAGVEVTLSRYDGAVHGFFRWLAKTELARAAVAEVGGALRAGLA